MVKVGLKGGRGFCKQGRIRAASFLNTTAIYDTKIDSRSIMRLRSPSAILILCFIVFLSVGILTALLPSCSAESGEANTQPEHTFGNQGEGQPSLSSSLTTILVIGVDELSKENAELTAIWFAHFRPINRAILLQGVPLDMESGGENPSKLSELFYWSPQSGVSADFLNELYKNVPVQPDIVVVMDKTFFSSGVDYLGGVFIGDQRLDGNQVVSFLDLLKQDSLAQVTAQQRVLEALRVNLSIFNNIPDITPLLNLIPEHAYVSVPAAQLVVLVSPLLPLNPESVRVEIIVPVGNP